MGKITESTLVPISLVITLMTGFWYVNGIASTGVETKERVDRVVKRYVETTDKIFDAITEMKEDIAALRANQNKGK